MVRAAHRATPTVLRLDTGSDVPPPAAIVRAGAILRKGGLVAFPTDTLYALGADAANPRALERLFAAKGRSPERPVPLLVADVAMAARVAGALPEVAERLVARYWPGPLTLLLPAPQGSSPFVTGSSHRIGLRVPNAPVALALICRLGRPVTGTSANRTFAREPRDAQDVLRQLGNRLDLILDGGPVPIGRPSTVVDVTARPPIVVREGAIRSEEILRLLAAPLASTARRRP
jgi:L-threonylcarbamoyladenylate synthase